MKNTLNKTLIFGAAFCSVLFYGGIAFSCSLENGWAEYEACMQQSCASRGGFFNGSVCVKCAKGMKPSQKLGTCVSEDTTDEDVEERYQKEQAERARIAASCSDVQEYDERQNKCVFSPSKAREKAKAEAEAQKAAEEAAKEEDEDMPDEGDFDMGAAGASGAPAGGGGNANPRNSGEATDLGELSERNLYGLGLEGEAEQPGEEEASVATKLTTKTDKDGKVSTETSVKEGMEAPKSDGEASEDGSSSDDADAAKAEQDAKEAAEDAKKDEAKSDGSEQYNGLYNGFHIIPDMMAMHCKIMGEDVANDPELFIDCIKQYVSEMNNPNASAKAEAEKEYQLLRYKILVDAGSNAMTKSQVVENQVNANNDSVEAYSEGKTVSDDNKALIAALTQINKMLNDIRELQVESLKYDVISGIANIDPSIIMEEEEGKKKEKEKQKSKSSGDNSAPSVSTVDVKAESSSNSVQD